MTRSLSALCLAGALLALAACDGTSPRLAPPPGGNGGNDGGNGGGDGGNGNGGGMQPPPAVQLRNLVIDNINNSTTPTARPIDINDLNIEIDTTPVNLDLVTG
ncbi:hypothetical protein KHP57_00825 [Algiphilus sp. NNCM1]|nr:hypothetical protein [Algiphilus acroporae]